MKINKTEIMAFVVFEDGTGDLYNLNSIDFMNAEDEIIKMLAKSEGLPPINQITLFRTVGQKMVNKQKLNKIQYQKPILPVN